MIENNNFDRVDNFQQQVSQVDYPQVDNFLKNWFSDDIKIVIEDIFNDDSDLKDSFESFLKMASFQDKMVCKRHLLDAKDGNEIKNTIMENVSWWCRIVETVLPSSFDNNITNIIDIREKEQENKEEEQGNKEKEQENKKEEQDWLDTINILKYYEESINLRNKLLVEHPTLDNDTKQWSQAYNDAKDLLQNNGTLDKLTALGIDQDGYISLIATINVAQNNPEYQTLRESQDFSLLYIAVKNLNNACNIPDTSFDSFSKNNIKNTRIELFHETIWNKWLIEQRQKNIESHKSDYEKLFNVENDDELIQKYWRFLEWTWKNLMEKWLKNPASLSPEESDNLMNFVYFKQQEVENKTKDMVEEHCMTSQVKWFLSCIPKRYVSQFQFNKANEIGFNQDGVLKLDWHIKWVDFSLRQNTNDENARLQTSTKLFRDQDRNLNFTWKYKNSPFILPTAFQVFDAALLAVKNDDLTKLQNQDDYFDMLEDSILKNMDKLYAGTEYAHHYVENQIKSEEIIHETMQIFNLIWGWNIENLSNIDNEKLYKFFDTLEFNLSVMTNKEKERFKQCLWILWKKIVEWWNIAWSDNFVKDTQLASFLGSKDSTMKILRWMWWLDNDLSFFDVFSFFLCQDERNESWNRKIINLNELYNAVNGDSEKCLIAMWRYEDMKKSDADTFLEDQIQMC